MALGTGRLTTTVHFSAFDHLSRASTLSRPASDSGARDAQRLVQGDLLYNVAQGRTQLDAGVQLRRESITADRLSTVSPRILSVEPKVSVGIFEPASGGKATGDNLPKIGDNIGVFGQ